MEAGNYSLEFICKCHLKYQFKGNEMSTFHATAMHTQPTQRSWEKCIKARFTTTCFFTLLMQQTKIFPTKMVNNFWREKKRFENISLIQK